MRAYSFFEFTYFTHKNEYIVFDYICNQTQFIKLKLKLLQPGETPYTRLSIM